MNRIYYLPGFIILVFLPLAFLIYLLIHTEELKTKSALEVFYLAQRPNWIVDIVLRHSQIRNFNGNSIDQLEQLCKRVAITNDTSYAFIVELDRTNHYSDFVRVLDIFGTNDIVFSIYQEKIYGHHIRPYRDVFGGIQHEKRRTFAESFTAGYEIFLTDRPVLNAAIPILIGWLVLSVLNVQRLVSTKKRWLTTRSS